MFLEVPTLAVGEHADCGFRKSAWVVSNALAVVFNCLTFLLEGPHGFH